MSKSRSLNKVMLIGNLTKDPVIRESSNKTVVVCTFGIATNTSWKDANNETQERAEFHNIVAFNKLAEICAQVLSKGMLVYLEGELRTRVKVDANGNKIYKTEIKLNDMILLNSKDKKGVGIDAAKNAGSELMDKVGADIPEENPADNIPQDSNEDHDFDEKDLF